MKEIIGKIIIPVVAALAVALLTFLGYRTRDWWGAVLKRLRAEPSKGTYFTILVAKLDGDADSSQTGHILSTLERELGGAGETRMHILDWPEALQLGPGERTKALRKAEEIGRAWLKRQNADVLVWGEVAARDKVLRLRFLADGSGGGAISYGLSEKLELPADFGADLGAVLVVQAAASIRPVFERAGETLAQIIAPVVNRLRPLAQNPPASFSGDAKARLWHAYAAGEQRLGEESGDNQRLQTAISYYNKVLTEWTRERVPLDWATIQNNLGVTLGMKGERESGTESLQQAVEAFRAALEERTRESVPLDWAGTQNNLGNALLRLGERESGTQGLQQAVQAYRLALEEFTRECTQLGWAMIQNNLGNALLRLGERESGTQSLQQAVEAYRAALQERTRERVRLYWATTQNNLGLVLEILADRQAKTDKAAGCRTLNEARESMRAALEVRREARASYYVEQSQCHLERIDATIARLCG